MSPRDVRAILENLELGADEGVELAFHQDVPQRTHYVNQWSVCELCFLDASLHVLEISPGHPDLLTFLRTGNT
jgi:hypothetical protein